MPTIIVGVVFFIIGFIGGALVFRKHQSRIEEDAGKISAIAQAVKDTTKSL